MLGRSFHVTSIVPSEFTTQSPSSMVGIFSTSHGCGFRSASRYVQYAFNACSTSMAAICANCTPNPFGSCDMPIVNVLTPPDGADVAAACVGAAAGGCVAAAGACVGDVGACVACAAGGACTGAHPAARIKTSPMRTSVIIFDGRTISSSS